VSAPCAVMGVKQWECKPERKYPDGLQTNGYWGASGTSVLNRYILTQKAVSLVGSGDRYYSISKWRQTGHRQIRPTSVNEDTVNYDPSATTPAQKLTA
jgi:hypothetical protein